MWRIVLVVLPVLAAAACSTGTPPRAAGAVTVVAVEDTWGSIARQLGGTKAVVTSLLTSPNADPHEYEPTAADARRLAAAQLVVTNGIGYDPWADRLLSANPVPGRAVVNVGDLVGLQAGANPHQWYAPAVIERVADAITARYRALAPADAAYFAARRADFDTTALGDYRALVARIRARYAGTPIGASESVVVPLADALGLRVLTPPPFLDAVAEGGEPASSDEATVDRQLRTHAVEVFVYNPQNATPQVRRLVDLARANGIPVTTLTETLTPKGATFQDWQVAQLRALESALAS